MAEIELRKVSKSWGSFVGVENFDLTVADKEFLVLLGPSGCGKTTTMRMIAGLEDVSEGAIAFDGQVVNGLEPKDRDVAMVFQSYALYPNMTVYENIRFPLKVRGIDPRGHDEKVRRASALVELDDFLHRRPAELSGGQRQRVALARAIVAGPRLILADEPTGNLDGKTGNSVIDLLFSLRADHGATLLLITHNMDTVARIADDVVRIGPHE